MVKRLVEVDQDALAEAADLLGTTGVQETVTAALAEISGLFLRLEARDEADKAVGGGDEADQPASENYQ